MFMRNMYFGIIILFQTGVGVPTNIFLLFLYSFNYFSGSRMKPLNLIFTQLNFINIMMFLKGGSEVAMHLGMENFLNDAGCKFVLFLHRLALALSVCFTCYLSIFQAITISSNVSRLGKFKVWVSHYIIHSCFFFQIFNLLLEMPVLFSVTGPRYMNNITFKLNFGYCSLESHNDVYWSLFAVRNVFSLVLIVCISCYIAHLLYRHHQKVETIQKSNLSARTSLEVRATQTILLLMSTFVFFYSLTSISIICMNYFYQERFWLLSVCSILSLCFLSFSPFILFPRGLRVLLYFWAGKKFLLTQIYLPISCHSDFFLKHISDHVTPLYYTLLTCYSFRKQETRWQSKSINLVKLSQHFPPNNFKIIFKWNCGVTESTKCQSETFF